MDWERDATPGLGRGLSFPTLGVELAASVGLFTLAGWWLDRRLGTGPWLLVTLAMLAVAGSLIRIIRRASRASDPDA